MLSDFRAQKLRAFFKAIDHNRDGLLERADYEAIVAELLRLRSVDDASPNAVALRAGYMILWNYLPSTSVDVDTFLAVCGEVLVPSPAADLWSRSISEQVFQFLDEDSDGAIALEEFRRYSLAHSVDPAQVDATFQRLDLDGDGLISLAEWVAVSRDFLYSEDPEAPGNHLWGPY